jgi:hypothetical protein
MDLQPEAELKGPGCACSQRPSHQISSEFSGGREDPSLPAPPQSSQDPEKAHTRGHALHSSTIQFNSVMEACVHLS